MLTFQQLTIGQTFQSRRLAPLTAEEIIQFATQFDPQPFHLDPQAAKNSFFGELVASGWHTASLTMRLLTETLVIQGGLIGNRGELSWSRPVKVGDSLSISVQIEDIRRSQKQASLAYIQAHIITRNQDEDIVQEMRCQIVVNTAA